MDNQFIHWSLHQFSHLPWRKTRSLYRTLVSEIMLQQTTVSTVENKFEAFLHRFADLKALAQASEDEVVIAWKGLGYYRRAKNLKKAAVYIIEKHQGEIPDNYQALSRIPGVGHYTAKAILAIGHDHQELAIDANLQRVIARLYGFKQRVGNGLIATIDSKFNKGEIFSGLKEYGGRALNEALMDVGRVYCQKNKAHCLRCPLRADCFAFRNDVVESCPEYPRNDQKKHSLKLLRVLVRDNDKVLAYKKPPHLWLSGQWELPTFIVCSSDQAIKQYPRLTTQPKKVIYRFKSSITKYQIDNAVVEMSLLQFKKKFKTLQGLHFVSQNKANENLASSTIKALNL